LTVSDLSAEAAPSDLHRLADKFFFEGGGCANVDDSTLAVNDELRLARYFLSHHLRDGVPTIRYYLGST
jgi:hypothetical protein